MGVTSKIHCHKCGHEFERDYGIGVLGKGTLYCDRIADYRTAWAHFEKKFNDKNT